MKLMDGMVDVPYSLQQAKTKITSNSTTTMSNMTWTKTPKESENSADATGEEHLDRDTVNDDADNVETTNEAGGRHRGHPVWTKTKNQAESRGSESTSTETTSSSAVVIVNESGDEHSKRITANLEPDRIKSQVLSCYMSATTWTKINKMVKTVKTVKKKAGQQQQQEMRFQERTRKSEDSSNWREVHPRKRNNEWKNWANASKDVSETKECKDNKKSKKISKTSKVSATSQESDPEKRKCSLQRLRMKERYHYITERDLQCLWWIIQKTLRREWARRIWKWKQHWRAHQRHWRIDENFRGHEWRIERCDQETHKR